MKISTVKTEDGYDVTIVISVKRWIDVVSEIRQWMKLFPDESQEN